jgi:cell division protein DivIC
LAKSKNTRKSKISKKAKLRILLFFIFGGIIGSLSYSFFSNVNKIVSIKKEKQVLNDRIAELTDEEKVLNSDIKKLEDPEYVARYAREKYLYSKDGELIIRIPDEDN